LYISPGSLVHFHCFSKRDSWTQISMFSTGEIALNRLHHVAATFAESTPYNVVTFYIDGQVVGTSTTSETGCMQVDNLIAVGSGVRGYIDEARYEGRVVSQAELQSRYEAGANPPGLISEWRFDRKNISAVYDPVHQYDGSLTTNALSDFYSQWGPGMPIGSFSGDDYVTISDPSSPSYPPGDLNSIDTKMSIEVHFRTPPATATGTKYITSRWGATNDAYSWYVNWYKSGATRRLSFRVNDASNHWLTTAVNGLEHDRWYHVVFTFDGTQGSEADRTQAYVDGVLSEVTRTYSDPSPTSIRSGAACPIYIGARGGTSSYRYVSEIDYVRIYNMALNTDGTYSGGTWVNTNRDDIKFLFDHRAAIWQNSYYGDYPGNRYADE